MHDSAEGCLNRIHNRNRPYEQRIELGFLEEISEHYETLFGNWIKSPVMKIATSDLDYSNPGSIEKVIQQIKFYISV